MSEKNSINELEKKDCRNDKAMKNFESKCELKDYDCCKRSAVDKENYRNKENKFIRNDHKKFSHNEVKESEPFSIPIIPNIPNKKIHNDEILDMNSINNEDNLIENDFPKDGESPKVIPRSILPYPLPDMHITMINNEMKIYNVTDKESVIDEIEEAILNSNTPKELYDNLCLRMNNYFGQNSKKFVAKLLIYKRKFCRNGSICGRKSTCVFIHPDERTEKDSKSERGLVDLDNPAKRQKNSQNDEIIINKVPEYHSQVKIIQEYCERFGDVKHIRQLKPGKFLVKFVDPRCASDLIYSNEIIFNDVGITKFFNLYKNENKNQEFDVVLLNLLSENDALIDKLYQKGEVQIASRMRGIMTELRDVILKSEVRKDN
ncbi:hypothetical protein DMUE_0204 [Dictyocoela muelleri]|nr:hypothetical protein DMUE_0204 [Dictyocoela muelleri]